MCCQQEDNQVLTRMDKAFKQIPDKVRIQPKVEYKKGEIQGESVKIKNKWRTALKTAQADKTSPITQTNLNSAYFMRPTQPGSSLTHASGKTSQG